jgi:hypothetical protein
MLVVNIPDICIFRRHVEFPGTLGLSGFLIYRTVLYVFAGFFYINYYKGRKVADDGT